MNIDELFHNPTSLLLCFVWEYLRLYCCKSGLGILLWSLIISPDDSCRVLSKCSEVNTGVYSVSRKGGELLHLLILPATSWDRVSRDYLRAPILVTVCPCVTSQHKSSVLPCRSRSREQERITGAERRALSLRQRYRVSRPRALIALFALAKLWINILILHAACFYSNLATTFLERVFTSSFWLLLSFVLVVWKWWRTEPEPPLLHEFTVPS